MRGFLGGIPLQWVQSASAASFQEGKSVMERLQFKKTGLELQIKKASNDLEAVNELIEMLRADPNLDALLSSLVKGDII